jgi:YidC/Oxa1 family membrane protein insertase
MNRRILTALALSLLTVWLFQYFTRKTEPTRTGGVVDSSQLQSGKLYKSPVQETWHREPRREIDFVDTEIKKSQEVRTIVETPLTTVAFSNFGGIIQSLLFKKHMGKNEEPLNTIASDPLEEREEGCFLIALDEKTPYLYTLVENEKKDGFRRVVYQAKTSDWLIIKSYVLYDDTYKIDIGFNFEPLKKNATPINPRLFFVSPYVQEVEKDEATAFISYDGNSISNIYKSKELEGVWALPAMFGGADKYFAHGMIKDDKHFSQGGFLKRVNNKLFSIVEGPEIKEKKNWFISFYMGPKLLHDLSIVDERLVDLLSFGWLSWFCKLLLRLLEFLYKHIGNFGLAIIVLTVIIKLPFVPLTISSRRKIEEYQKYQPTIQRIRAKYKHDMKQQQIEIMKFHQEHNLSPTTPLIGCLPLIIQLPILFSLYKVLGNYLLLYQAPFFGWITDLSSQDPYYILPLLMGATMLWQQTLAPVADQKQRMVMMFMPIAMTAVFINFPAGLVLYWFVNNLLTVGEDLLRKKVFS